MIHTVILIIYLFDLFLLTPILDYQADNDENVATTSDNSYQDESSFLTSNQASNNGDVDSANDQPQDNVDTDQGDEPEEGSVADSASTACGSSDMNVIEILSDEDDSLKSNFKKEAKKDRRGAKNRRVDNLATQFNLSNSDDSGIDCNVLPLVKDMSSNNAERQDITVPDTKLSVTVQSDQSVSNQQISKSNSESVSMENRITIAVDNAINSYNGLTHGKIITCLNCKNCSETSVDSTLDPSVATQKSNNTVDASTFTEDLHISESNADLNNQINVDKIEVLGVSKELGQRARVTITTDSYSQTTSQNSDISAVLTLNRESTITEPGTSGQQLQQRKLTSQQLKDVLSSLDSKLMMTHLNHNGMP